MFVILGFKDTIKTLRTLLEDPPTFWETAAGLFSEGPLGFKYPNPLKTVDIEDHPRLIQDLMNNASSKSYFVREDVLELIRNL